MVRARSLVLALSVWVTACTSAAVSPTPEMIPSPIASAPPASPEGTPHTSPTTAPRGFIPLGSLVQAVADRLRVRDVPGATTEVVATLAAGQRVRVTDGPQELDGMQWFEVSILPSDVVGWVASGDESGPWLAIVENGELTLASGPAVTNVWANGDRQPLIQLAPGWDAGQMAWSPTGDRLAFAEMALNDTRECVREASIVTVDPTGQVIARTSPPQGSTDLGPLWSPDGATLAFTRSTSACDSITQESGASELYAVAADGGSERLVVADVVAPVWSPRGDALAFLRFDPAPTGLAGDLRGLEIWMADVDGTGLRRLGGRADIPGERERLADRVVWAPDGSLLAFTRSVGPELADTEIDVMDIDGRLWGITTVHAEVRDLTWLPDGAGLAYVEGGRATAVVVISVDGSELARFDLTDGVPDRLVVAPDGTALAWRIQGTTTLRIQALAGAVQTIDRVEAVDMAWRPILRTAR